MAGPLGSSLLQATVLIKNTLPLKRILRCLRVLVQVHVNKVLMSGVRAYTCTCVSL